MVRPMVPQLQYFPESPFFSLMVRLILQLFATKSSAGKGRASQGSGFAGDMASFIVDAFPSFKISFFQRISARNPKGFPPTNPFRHHDDVQRKPRRQRVRRHLRIHTVAVPSDIQQKVL